MIAVPCENGPCDHYIADHEPGDGPCRVEDCPCDRYIVENP